MLRRDEGEAGEEDAKRKKSGIHGVAFPFLLVALFLSLAPD